MYARVNGVETWYDVRGEGEPLVLLHGGFSDSRDFEPNLAGLPGFRVHRVDRRGHGRTPDVPGPVSMDLLTADVIAFLEDVVGEPSHLVGYSVGGVPAMGVATRRPELVRRLVLISTAYDREGWMFLPSPEGELPPELVDRYAEVSPDGRDHLRVVVEKFGRAAQEEPGLSPGDLERITSSTLVMGSDDDIIHLEHTIALYRGIGPAQLVVVPGTSHSLLIEKPELCASLVADFLTGEDPKPLMPIRRMSCPSPRHR